MGTVLVSELSYMGTVLNYFTFRLTVPIDIRMKIWTGKGIGGHIAPNFGRVILIYYCHFITLDGTAKCLSNIGLCSDSRR